jgi:hypothetical protein
VITCCSRAGSPLARSGYELDAFSSRLDAHQLDHRGADRLQIDGRDLQPHLPLLDARRVEQLVDERPLLPGAALERLDGALLTVGVEHAALEQGNPSERGIERRPELVRQRREKIVLDAIGLLGQPARLLLPLERRHPLLFGTAHAQQGIQGGHDHVGRGGLGKISIGAAFEAAHPVCV